MKRIACAVFLLLLVVPAVLAQVRESVTVSVVEVPVYVTAGGEPITNLTRENFRLFVNGHAQSIDYFDQIDFATLSPERARDPRQRRMYMLVFDLTVTPNQLARAQRAAVKLLDDAAENHSFAIATIGAKPLAVIVPFTRDRMALRHAVRGLRVSLIGDPLHLALSADERGREIGGADGFDDPRFSGADELDSDALSVIGNEIYELGEVATRLGGMEGYKHVVLLSRGFDATLLHGVGPARKRMDLRTGPLRSLRELDRPFYDSALTTPNAALLADLRLMYEKFAKAGVFLDAIDTGGIRPLQTSWDNEALYALTRDTGGTVIDHRNDLTQAIQLLIDRQRVVYVLGFRPSTTNRGAATNRIDVKLVDVPRGARAAFRPSFSTVADPPDNADRLRLADIVMNDIPQNGVTTTARVDTASDGATVEMEIPGREILAHAVADAVGAEAMFYVVSGSTVVAFRTKKITVDVPRAGAALQETPLRVRETFDLPPGKYAAKVLVRIDGSGALGFARSDFTIP